MFSTVRMLMLSLFLVACASGPDSVSQMVVVETTVASNDPHEIERLITVPLERAIHTLTGFTRTESETTHGSCRIHVFYTRAPDPETVRQLESAVLAEWANFSAMASKPVVSIKSVARP